MGGRKLSVFVWCEVIVWGVDGMSFFPLARVTLFQSVPGSAHKNIPKHTSMHILCKPMHARTQYQKCIWWKTDTPTSPIHAGKKDNTTTAYAKYTQSLQLCSILTHWLICWVQHQISQCKGFAEIEFPKTLHNKSTANIHAYCITSVYIERCIVWVIANNNNNNNTYCSSVCLCKENAAYRDIS